MISFDEAVELIGRNALPGGTEMAGLDEVAGRVLASPIVARLDSPRCAVSAMDGYAVREADLAAAPARLKLVGESFPGSGWEGKLKRGDTVRIFTGAPLPDGADRVVMQENAQREGDAVLVTEYPGPARYIRQRGGDFAAGEELIAPPRLLDARAIVAAAGADYAEVEVYRQPRARILSTGDELAEPGTAAATQGRIPDSVAVGVAAVARAWGARILDRTRLPDDVAQLERAALAAVTDADLVIVTGGASVGDKDYARRMFAPASLELIFSTVAIKPGKPVWLGRAGNAFVMGLPGNPTSALVTARLLLAPLIAGITGRRIEEALRWQAVPLSHDLAGCGSRETFHRARLVNRTVALLPFQDSSGQKALVDADVLVRQSAHSKAVPAGALVDVLAF